MDDPNTIYQRVSSLEMSDVKETGGIRLKFRIDDGSDVRLELPGDVAHQLVFFAPQYLSDYHITPSSDGGQVSIGIQTTTDIRRAKTPHAPLPIPDRFCAPVGRIVATWGQFESSFDAFHDAVVKASQADPHSKPPSFRRRRQHLLKLARDYFGRSSGLFQHLKKIVAIAASLHKPRNLIAHGHYHLFISVKKAADELTPSVTIRMAAEGKGVRLEFDYEQLERLYYDVANLSGLMNQMAVPDYAAALPLPSHEISLLQGFLNSNLSHPMFSTLEDPPRSSLS